MGLTQKLGTIPLAIFTDASNNIGIGGSPSGSFKFEVTGTGRYTGALTTSSTITSGDTITLGAAAVGGFWTWGSTISYLVAGTGKSLNLNPNGASGTTGLSIATSGAATFSNRVTANDYAFTGTGAVFQGTASAGTAAQYGYFQNTGGVFYFGRDNSTASEFGVGAYSTVLWNSGNNAMVFATNNTERMRITNNLLVGTSTDPVAGVIVGSQSASNWTIYGRNTSSSQVPYVFLSEFTNQAPNNTQSYFYYAGDNSAARFQVRGNGGIYNYQANDVNLSDISTKKDIILCESYWDKFKAIEIVKFKYKDQTHDDYNIGVIAQQVEEVAPEFIDTDDWAKPTEEAKTMKAVYTADLNHATIKVLQEAMAKIEELEAKVSALENKS